MNLCVFVLSIVFLTLGLSGCTKRDQKPAPAPKSGDAVPAASATGGAEAPRGDKSSKPTAETAASPSSPSEPPVTLVGAYTISEVQEKSGVTMISPANATEIIFMSDGSYVRTSMKNGRVDHNDSGQYRIEGKDKLVLAIQMSGHQIQVPPVEKAHTFSLSPDGEELRMTSAGGKVALFRRTRRPSAK